MSGPRATSVWDGVIDQPGAVARLTASLAAPVHAYLFVGPPGSTKDEAARAFAALLVNGGVDGRDQRAAHLALTGQHPDVREVQRTGASINVDQARDVIRLAALAPVEAPCKVVILHEFHLLDATGAAVLLKTIEEPPRSTTFIVLADLVPADLVTIASRCVRIEFHALDTDAVTSTLVADGVPRTTAVIAATASSGDITRARILAADGDLLDRRNTFAGVPRRLDGTGATVMALTEELLGRISDSGAALAARHADEVADVDARIARFGLRGSGKQTLEARHKREARRHRTDEIRSGLGVLAAAYRDALVAGVGGWPDATDGHASHRTGAYASAIERVHDAVEQLDRNPNEALLFQSLLWSLPPIS